MGINRFESPPIKNSLKYLFFLSLFHSLSVFFSYSRLTRISFPRVFPHKVYILFSGIRQERASSDIPRWICVCVCVQGNTEKTGINRTSGAQRFRSYGREIELPVSVVLRSKIHMKNLLYAAAGVYVAILTDIGGDITDRIPHAFNTRANVVAVLRAVYEPDLRFICFVIYYR